MSDNLPHSADVASRSIKVHVDDCRGLTSGFVVELIIWQFINRRCEEATYYTAPRKLGIIFYFLPEHRFFNGQACITNSEEELIFQ